MTHLVKSLEVDARPYVPGESLLNIRVYGEIPKDGGWVVRSRRTPGRQWYVPADKFEKYYTAA